MNVYIYKTNIQTKKLARTIETLLQKFQSISHYSIDLEDCDKVLRIEAEAKLAENQLQYELLNQGVFLEQLPD